MITCDDKRRKRTRSDRVVEQRGKEILMFIVLKKTRFGTSRVQDT